MFINNDKKICYYWNNGLSSGFTPVNSSAAVRTNIVHRNNNEVYFVNSNQKLSKLIKSGAIWILSNIETELIKPNSKIQTSNATNQVFYVRETDGRICTFWTNGTSNGNALLNAKSIPVMPGSDIHLSTDGKMVFYLGIDNQFHVIFHDGCQWNVSTLNDNCGGSQNYASFGMNNLNTIIFFDGVKIQELKVPIINKNYVYRKSTFLEMNGFKYNAVIADYCPTFYRRNGQVFIGPHPHYCEDYNQMVCSSNVQCSDLLDSHLTNIATAGFNAIRFNDLTVSCNNNINKLYPNLDNNLYVNIYDINVNGTGWISNKVIVTNELRTQLFESINNLVNRAGAIGLKVNFFTGLQGGQYQHNVSCHDNYSNYLFSFASYFKNNPNILMYSIMLEPDFSTNSQVLLDKSQVCNTINGWYNRIREADKNHLVSIGLMDYFALGNFDPSIMNIDVVTWHVYPDMTQQYPYYNFDAFYQKLYWISNVMKSTLQKPWIIGETGIPSVDNPYLFNGSPNFRLVVTDTDQRNFAINAIMNVFSVGGSGIGWWQYRDVFSSNPGDLGVYFGLVDHEGNNKVILSPSVFQNIPNCNCNLINTPNDYFNHNNSYNVLTSGFVYGEGGPIKDAFIYVNGWDCGNKFYFTFSTSTGYFYLKTPCSRSSHALNIIASGKQNFVISNPNASSNYYLSSFICPSSIKSSDSIYISNDQHIIKDTTINNNFVNIFPNPTNGIINIDNLDGTDNNMLFLTDAYGNTIKDICIKGSKSFVIDITSYPNGVYFISLISLEKKITYKIVKNSILR